MPNKLTLYAHPVAQPSRAIIWILALLGVQNELKVTMPGQDTNKPEFLELFPLGTVPSLHVQDEEGKTVIAVSDFLAIAEYACAIAGEKGEAFLPKDPVVRAKVLQMAVHGQITLRPITGEVFRPLFLSYLSKQPVSLTKEQLNAFLSPNFEGKVVDMSRAAGWTKAKFDGPDELIENPKSVFLVPEAGNKPTIADFINYAETYQLEALGLLGEIDARRPAFKRWHDAMKALPAWDKIHEVVNGFCAANLKPLVPQ